MEETNNSTIERRSQRRYTYKPEYYPMIDCQTGRYKVINIAEDGMKLEISRDPDQPMRTQSVINGYLRFSNGSQISILGELVWIIGDKMGIKPNQPISQEIIAAEAAHFQSSE